MHWRPDPGIFTHLNYDFDTIAQRFRELAYLNKGLWIRLLDQRDGHETNFYFEGGISSFVRHLNRDRQVLQPVPLHAERDLENTSVEVALQYNDGFNEHVYAFANTIHTIDGGSHLTGFRSALTRALNDFARRNKFLKDSDS